MIALTHVHCWAQVADCTDAGVAPPEDWATGFHALTLGLGTCGVLQLIMKLLDLNPHLLAAQVHTGWVYHLLLLLLHSGLLLQLLLLCSSYAQHMCCA